MNNRITYATLANLIALMNEDQRDSDVTVEIDGECMAACLKICGPNHDSLENDHPVLFVPPDVVSRTTGEVTSGLGDRTEDYRMIAKNIGL